jgi:protein-L-isoaspartate(D-aspartate) O-methyltransferase
MAKDRFENQRQALADKLEGNSHELSPRVIEAFRAIPREFFLPEAQQRFAYVDAALPLAEAQTVSQPSMIAVMLEALDCKSHHRALEVGAGSGYASALLARLVKEVFAVEIRPSLVELAKRNLARASVENVHVVLSDGSLGLAAHAPYDRIMVSAGAESVPDDLVRELAIGGRIAIPVGHRIQQELRVGEKQSDGSMVWQSSVRCVFVPLVTPGADADADDDTANEDEFSSQSDPPRRWGR